MAPVVASFSTGGSEGGGSTSATVAAPSGSVNGSSRLVAITFEDQSAESTPTSMTASGWTQLGSHTGATNTFHCRVWTRVHNGSANYSFGVVSSYPLTVFIARITGHNEATIGSAVPLFTSTATASTSHSSPSLTPPVADCLELRAFTGVNNYGSTSYTPPSGRTEVADWGSPGGWQRSEVARAVLATTAATGTKSATFSESSRYTSVALVVAPATQQVTAIAIASGEVFGALTVAPGAVAVSPSGIATVQTFGTPQVNLTVAPTGIGSGEAFGTATVVAGLLISPSGIGSGEAFGTPAISPMVVAGIASGEAFGTAQINLTVAPTGIGSGEVFGAPQVNLTVYPSGITSGEAFGTPTLTTGPVTVQLTGIGSGEAFGTPALDVTLDPAKLAFGQPGDRTGVTYELLCIARLPQVSGPPALFVVDQIPWTTLRYADVLSRPQELSATVRVQSISDVVAQRLLGPDRQATELRLLRNGQVVAAGPLAGWHRQSADDVELVATGLLGYLRRMIVLADLRFDQVDQHLIVAALVDQWQQNTEYGHAHYGIDTAQVSPSGKLRDRSYVRVEQHKIGQRVEELGAVDDGFDTEVHPATRALQLWHPRKGVDRTIGPLAVVLDHRVITSPDVMCSVAPDDLASLVFGTSSSAGSDSTLSATVVNAELAASFGLSAVMGTWQDVSEQTTLDGHVRALLDARGQALIVPGPKMRVTPDADLGSYDVGDTVALELGTDRLGITGPYRIRKRSVSVSGVGVETVDLELM